jgi:hypothetical protein
MIATGGHQKWAGTFSYDTRVEPKKVGANRCSIKQKSGAKCEGQVGAHERCPLVLRHFRDIVQKYVVTVLEIGEPSFAAFGC